MQAAALCLGVAVDLMADASPLQSALLSVIGPGMQMSNS